MRQTITQEVRRPIEDVFAVLSDVTKTPVWHPATLEERWTTPPPHGVGSRRIAVAKAMGSTTENEAEVTAFDPPHRLGIRTLTAPIDTEITIDLASSEGGTSVRWTTTMHPTGAWRLATKPALGAFSRATSRGLERLAELMAAGDL